MTIAEAIYVLSAVTSLVAAALLLRQYRRSRTALLLASLFETHSRNVGEPVK